MYRSIIVLCIAIGLIMPCVAQAQGGHDRTYVSSNFVLNLDNTNCGFLKSVDGGAISAEVINEPAGPSYFVSKHIGQPRYEEFTAQIGFSMSKPIYEWIAQSWKTNTQRRNGSVITCDYNLNAKSKREFSQALLTETTIPACDGSSKEPAYMTIKFAPEYTRSVAADGGKAVDGGKNEQKVWLPSNFQLTIDGLDCSKVNKVDSFTVKQTVVTDDIGDARDYQKESGKLEFPNLTISLSEAGAQSWFDWHKDFVINGNNDESKEKDGTLVFLSPNRQTELARVKFYNLGIFKIENDKAEANADQIKRVTASLYCERMEFEYLNRQIGGGSGSATSTGTASNTTRSETTTTADTQKAEQPTDDCQLGVTYTTGVANPINLTVNSVEYTAERRKVGKEYRRPEPGEKMVVVHYTLQNPSKSDINVGTASVDWTLTDSNSVNYQRDRYAGVEESGTVLSQSLAPGQSVNCFACFRMPAKGQIARLVAAAHGDTQGKAGYRLEGKMTPLPALYAEPEDPTGSTRRRVVTGKTGESYQVLDYDIKVDSIEYTTQPILDWKLPEGQKYLLATVEYTNFTGAAFPVSGSNIEVLDADEVPYVSKGTLAANSLRAVKPQPEPEAAVKFRTVYQVPKDLRLQCFNIKNSGKTMVRIDQSGFRPLAAGR